MLHQRTSIDGLPPVKVFSTVGATAVGLHMLRHTMCTDVYSTPMIFLDKPAIIKAILEAYALAEKLDNEKVDVVHQLRMHDEFNIEPIDEGESLVSVIGTLTVQCMMEPTACLVVFPTQQNVLLVLGHDKTFYVIDVLHKLFYTTSSPEYDVGEYQKLYGGEGSVFHASFYTFKQSQSQDEPPLVVEKVPEPNDGGQESAKKRVKTTTTTTTEKKKK